MAYPSSSSSSSSYSESSSFKKCNFKLNLEKDEKFRNTNGNTSSARERQGKSSIMAASSASSCSSRSRIIRGAKNTSSSFTGQRRRLLSSALLAGLADVVMAQQSTYCTYSGGTLDKQEERCLSTCHVIDDEIEPRFWQWEEFCKMTSTNSEWNDECRDFYDCVLGCDVMQEVTQGKKLDVLSPSQRPQILTSIEPKNVVQERKCDAEKCRSYCARKQLATCHEMGYKALCEASSNTQFLRCDVDCNGAENLHPTSIFLLVFVFLVSMGLPI